MENEEEITEIPEEKPATLSEKVDSLAGLIKDEKEKEVREKKKKFRLPFSGKVSKSRLKKGYSTVVVINENSSVDFTREPIVDGTVKLKDTFHAVDNDDCLSYKGRPLLIIPKKSHLPYNPNKIKNTTYSQKHLMSRMLNETINTAKKIGIAGMSIGAIILIGVVAYAFIAG